MEVFREMYLRGEPEQLAATIDEIERRMPPGWSRDREAEGRLSTLDPDDGPNYLFRVDGVAHLPTASLFITGEEPGVLHVANVCPREDGQLTFAEYNAILEDFHRRSARPAAEATGANVELTSDRADLRHWLTETAAQKLIAYSRLANKGTGGAHPRDRARWLDFVVTAHRDGSHIDASTLRRWLIEVEDWYHEDADRLAAEYEFGGEVLSFSNVNGGRV